MFVQFHYWFNFSVFEGMKAVFEIKNDDIQVKVQPPPEDEINFESEFTVVERQIVYYYYQFQFMIYFILK